MRPAKPHTTHRLKMMEICAELTVEGKRFNSATLKHIDIITNSHCFVYSVEGVAREICTGIKQREDYRPDQNERRFGWMSENAALGEKQRNHPESV